MALLKALPFAMAACCFAGTVCQCAGFGMDAFSYVGGLSLLPWLFVFLSSHVFGFCGWHRLPLWYVLVCDCVNAADFKFVFPVSDLRVMGLHAVVAGLFMAYGLHLYRHGS